MDTYEKKYKELVGKIEKAYLYAQTDSTKAVLEEIRPELAEPKDKRIRKELIEHIKANCESDFILFQKFSPDDVIAWLEKQGEQEPILDVEIPFGAKDSELEEVSYSIPDGYHAEIEDNKIVIKKGEQKPTKVEPKFKVGDWIINRTGAIIMQIVNNIDFYESVEIGGQRRTDTYNYVECDFILWTIQDAKDGDVLAGGDWVFIFRDFHINGCPKCHCHYDLTLEEFKVDTYYSYMACGVNIYPATKEQRKFLFQKMREAGYEWDSKKKELKRIEQVDGFDAELNALLKKYEYLPNDEMVECLKFYTAELINNK